MLQHRVACASVTWLCLVSLLAVVTVVSIAEPAGSTGWQVVGQIGGPTSAVAVQGGYAYAGVGLRLVVLDVTNPVTPTEIGATVPLPYFVEDIAISGTLAYVAAGGAGLRVVDISDPANPTEIGAWDSPGYAEGVAAVGSYAYLADGPYGLRAIRITDPASPMPLGAAFGMNYAFDVAVAGDYAYIAAAGAGLLVADLSDPGKPVEAGTLDTPGYTYGVAVSGTTAYVADAWGGLRVVDLSQPGAPSEVGACDTPGWALGVVTLGTVAYMADGANGLRVVDVSDPANPQEVGAYESVDLARRVAVAGNTVYLADLHGGLRVVSVVDVYHPIQVGVYGLLTEARYVAVQGSCAYVAAGFNGLQVVDISDPTHPREDGRYEFSTDNDFAYSVVVSGSYAYLAPITASPYRLHIIDVSDPGRPAGVGTMASDGMYREIVLRGQTIYAADEWGLRLIDVSDPMSPTQIGFLWLEENNQATTGLAVSGTVAYVAGAQNGLWIVDISDPVSPTVISSYPAPGGCTAVAVDGHSAYVVNGFDGLQIVDVADPAQPAGMGGLDTPGYANAVAISGTTAFVSDGGGGLWLSDVSDPWSPAPIVSYDTTGFSWQAVLAGDYLYVADSRGGLLILGRTTAGQEETPLAALFPSTVTGSLGTGVLPSPLNIDRPLPLSWLESRIEDRLAQTPGGRTSSGPNTANGFKSPSSSATAATPGACVVTSNADSGPGTLRRCLEQATAGDIITFDPSAFPPTSPVSICLMTELPPLTQGNLTIDGSDAGVILEGSDVPGWSTGLLIASDHNQVRGLQIAHFGYGVFIANGSRYNVVGGDRAQGVGITGQGNVISGNRTGIVIVGDDNTVLGNLIGTDASGLLAMPNDEGMGITGGAAYNRVGGSLLGEHNVVSGNRGQGVSIGGESTRENILAGNYVGLGIDGVTALGNHRGVVLSGGASGNVIGGASSGERNVVSGNDEHGILLSDAGTTHNAIIGNYIGTDATGTLRAGNHVGIGIYGTGFNRVGGAASGEGNVIGGNDAGMDIATYEDTDNLILGNYIGADASGTQAVGNGIGLSLGVSTRHSAIGGATATERNVISANDLGIVIGQAGSEYNWVLGNRIGTDAGGAIPLGNRSDGLFLMDYAAHSFVQDNIVAYNTADSPDRAGIYITQSPFNTIRRNSIHSHPGPGIVLADGGNQMLPAPVILTVTEYSVLGTACPGCIVELFSDAQDEGRVYEATAVANIAGLFAFWDRGGLQVGPYLTATATDGEGNTSEFSTPVARPVKVYLPIILKGH